jgi:hypothetical protein
MNLKPKPVINQEYDVISGPHDKPNEMLRVRVIRSDAVRPSDVERFFQCEVIMGARKGEIVSLHYGAFVL